MSNRTGSGNQGVRFLKSHLEILRMMFAKSCEPENKDIDEALKFIRDADTESGIEWTLGQEKKVNPFFRLNSDEIRQKVMNDQNLQDQKNLFIKLRSLRDNW